MTILVLKRCPMCNDESTCPANLVSHCRMCSVHRNNHGVHLVPVVDEHGEAFKKVSDPIDPFAYKYKCPECGHREARALPTISMKCTRCKVGENCLVYMDRVTTGGIPSPDGMLADGTIIDIKTTKPAVYDFEKHTTQQSLKEYCDAAEIGTQMHEAFEKQIQEHELTQEEIAALTNKPEEFKNETFKQAAIDSAIVSGWHMWRAGDVVQHRDEVKEYIFEHFATTTCYSKTMFIPKDQPGFNCTTEMYFNVTLLERQTTFETPGRLVIDDPIDFKDQETHVKLNMLYDQTNVMIKMLTKLVFDSENK